MLHGLRRIAGDPGANSRPSLRRALHGVDVSEEQEAGRMNPVRTCVACRKHAARAELLRVVEHDGRLVVDDRAVLPGRGAWVHPEARCLDQAVTRGAFSRALRVSGKPDIRPLENRLKTLMDN